MQNLPRAHAGVLQRADAPAPTCVHPQPAGLLAASKHTHGRHLTQPALPRLGGTLCADRAAKHAAARAAPLHGDELEQPARAGAADLLLREHDLHGRVPVHSRARRPSDFDRLLVFQLPCLRFPFASAWSGIWHSASLRSAPVPLITCHACASPSPLHGQAPVALALSPSSSDQLPCLRLPIAPEWSGAWRPCAQPLFL
jgi:hypothetical protein